MSSSVSGGGSRMGSNRAVTFWGLVFAVLALGAVIAFYWGGQQRTQFEQLTLIADKQLELSAEAGGLLGRAAQGRPLAFEELSELQAGFSSHADILMGKEGILQTVAPSRELAAVIRGLEGEFAQFQSVVAEGLSLRGPVSSAGPAIRRLRENIPTLGDGFQQLSEGMEKALSPVAQVHTVSKEAILLKQIENSLLMLGHGDVSMSGSAVALREHFDVFERTLNGLLSGDTDLGIKRIGNAAARSKLDKQAELYRSLEGDVELLKSVSSDLDKASVLSSRLDHLKVSIKDGLASYQLAVDKHHQQYSLIWKAGMVMGALALLALLLLVAQVQRDNRRQLKAIQEANQKSQNAILQLLDEMSTLAEGDLTVEATVSEEITGAIADSVNYAIEAMRQLVQTINLSSVRVENTAKQTQATTLELSESSKDQANQIERVSDAIEDLNRSIDKVSQNAEDSAEVADVSVSLSQKGVQAVRGTIDGMDVIRERIQDTSKRIKRLGESSQEIGDIVGLITDIADQTNILALNAAIQASAAGEGGRGFAVVADEVQRLAERSSNASKQIEALVKTIQADTNEAVQSMEQSTSHVVRGANLAEDSGRALEEIENVSHRLARLITDISSESREQAILSDKVTELMGAIQRITGQTVAGTNDTALAVGELVEQSLFLKQSVEGFKLSDELEELDVDILDIETEETEVEKPDDSLSLTS